MQHPVRFARAVALLIFAASNPASALIMNGSFDTLVPSNGTGGGWTTSTIDANGGWRSTTSENSFENFFILNHSGLSASDPAMEQTITGLVVGQWYAVTGEFEPFRPTTILPLRPTFGVEIVGVALEEYALATPYSVRTFELSFAATSTTHVLRLSAERNERDTAYAVDNVVMVERDPPVVTEPGAALPLAGVLGLIAAFRRGR